MSDKVGVVYGALARASALADKNDRWWAVEAYDVDSKLVVKMNPIYKDDNADDNV